MPRVVHRPRYMARCIECCRCVRICAELQEQFVWRVRGRGTHTTIEPDGPSLRERLFATFHTPQLWINALTSGYRDAAVGTPEYKLTAVRVERLTTPSGDGGAA